MTPVTIPIFVPHRGCPQQCSFCNQRTISGAQAAPTPQEAAQLCRRALDTLSPHARGEVAFFGGSFTAIPIAELCALLEAVQPFLRHPQMTGIRISTRPDGVEEGMLDLLEGYGVTAIELGAQSMDDRVLAANGRGHTSRDVAEAAGRIRRRGLTLGLQMMTGLYRSTGAKDLDTARQLADLGPQEVRIYPTVVLAGTQLDRLLQAGEYCPPSLEETVELCADLLELFRSREIRVLRLGLHASRELESQTTGGCYHPALGELCQSRLILRRLQAQLGELDAAPVTLWVHPRYRSRVVGQKRFNLRALERQGFTLTVRTDPGLPEPYILTQGDVT